MMRPEKRMTLVPLFGLNVVDAAKADLQERAEVCGCDVSTYRPPYPEVRSIVKFHADRVPLAQRQQVVDYALSELGY